MTAIRFQRRSSKHVVCMPLFDVSKRRPLWCLLRLGQRAHRKSFAQAGWDTRRSQQCHQDSGCRFLRNLFRRIERRPELRHCHFSDWCWDDSVDFHLRLGLKSTPLGLCFSSGCLLYLALTVSVINWKANGQCTVNRYKE